MHAVSRVVGAPVASPNPRGCSALAINALGFHPDINTTVGRDTVHDIAQHLSSQMYVSASGASIHRPVGKSKQGTRGELGWAPKLTCSLMQDEEIASDSPTDCCLQPAQNTWETKIPFYCIIGV